MTTPFLKRVEILGDWWSQVFEDEKINEVEWVSDYSEILSLCLTVNAKWVTPVDNQRMEPNVDIVWDLFCEWHGVDSGGDYFALQHFLECVDD